MPDPRNDIDPGGLLEYSVVFTDRSLNHMSQRFQAVMRDISHHLKAVYQAASVVVVPGGGTYGMEAVARQFATDKKCLVLRNGWFSYRWSQIFDMGSIPFQSDVLMALAEDNSEKPGYTPPAINEVTAYIRQYQPDLVFAPHVETASGILLPDDYLKAVSQEVHQYGGLFVLDCVASGALWVDMAELGVDILISAPQKGWSASPCAALVLLNQAATDKLQQTISTSFACDLKKWRQIMESYEKGGFAYHATMPTDALYQFRNSMLETIEFGLEKARENQCLLGSKVRTLFKQYGFKSVAAEGYQAPGVIVSYTDDPDIRNGSKFVAQGVQTAAGVPMQCGEPENFSTFRVGLFGLDKLGNIDRTVERIKTALDNL